MSEGQGGKSQRLPSRGPADTGTDYGAANDKSAEASSGRSSSPRRQALNLRDLPDLTDRLIQAGIYAEYAQYRHRYQQWRKGGAQGAWGELTAEALQSQSDPNQFEYWYPTASIFRWRYTLAYWKAIFFMVGALMFVFDAAMCFYNVKNAGPSIRVFPNAIGSVLFSIGTYMGYVQLINIATDDEEHTSLFLPDCNGMLQRLQVSSVIGTVAYFVGSLFFNVGCFGPIFPYPLSSSSLVFLEFMNILGSVGFVLGGICEIAHNGVFFGETSWRDAVWWASILNFIGGVMFLVASVPGMPTPDGMSSADFVQFNFMVGSFCFVLSSALFVVMWRCNDFGLTLVRQLNFALASGGLVGIGRSESQDHVGFRFLMPEEAPVIDSRASSPRRSLRGALFIIVYCWFAFVATANCLFMQQEFAKVKEAHLFELVLNMLMQVFLIVVIAVVLVLHSVLAEVPEEQPYFCALIASRLAFIAGAVVQTLWFVRYLKLNHLNDRDIGNELTGKTSTFF